MMARGPWLRRLLRGAWTAICGTSPAASIGLALLVLGTVFISMAIPRESLGLRAAALRRTVAAAPATGTSVIGLSDLGTYTTGLDGSFITARHLAESRADLTANLAGARLPLLRFDVGRMFGSLVGSSEENVRRAIQTAESVAPAP